jgi:DNA-binding Xre family transcriptional regulator
MQAYGWFAQQWAEAEGTLDYQIEGLELVIAERILEIMDKKEIHREKLAERLGIATSTLSRWIDEPSKLTVEKLLRIARALGCRLEVQIHEG